MKLARACLAQLLFLEDEIMHHSSSRRARAIPFVLSLVLCLSPQLLLWAQGKSLGSLHNDSPTDRLPLKPERKIEFTTDEGTWLSLDVSPDGRTVIFEMLGDIYTLSSGGGSANLLLGGMPFESQPRYSPDGSLITFLSDRDGAENVWIANADGSDPRNLSRETQMIFCSPAWTPDGKQIVVSRGTAKLPFELWLYNTDGAGIGVKIVTGKPTPEAPAQLNNALGAVASPDGRYFYYAQHLGRLAGANSAQFPLWQIARLDRRTGEEELMTQEQGGAFRPLLSPDGSKLVYATRYDGETGLRIRDLKSDQDHWLSYPVQRDDQESMLYSSRDLLPGYAFTPDGTALVASFGGKINRIEIPSRRTSVIPFNAHVSQDLGPLLNFPARVDAGPVRARIIQEPCVSPDGKRLAFSALAHLYVMDLLSGKPRQITNGSGGEFQPIWSPDGQWLAFVTWTDQGGDVWKVRADGIDQPQRLSRVSAYYRDLAWSPDGSRLVALRAPTRVQLLYQRNVSDLYPTRNQDLVWLPSGGGDTSVITHANGLHHPQFTTESDRVYFHTANDLVSLRFDGSDRRTHLEVTGNGAGGRRLGMAHVRVSPNGRWAIVMFHMLYTQIYLVAIPENNATFSVNVTTPKTLVRKFAESGADYLGWADGGNTVTWAAGATFFRQSLNSILAEPDQQSGVQTLSPAQDPVHRIVVNIEKPRKQPVGTIVLRGAQAITMRGDEVIRDAEIVITDNRIAGVGRRGSVAVPSGAKIIDVGGKTIVPGFIDTHDHWLDIQRGVLDLRNWNFLLTLAYGVTTGRDPQIESIDTFVYGDLVETGDILGPRVFTTGGGIFWSLDLQSLDQAEKVVAKYKYLYRTNMVKCYLVGNRRQRQLLVEACNKLGIMPTTEGQEDAKLGLTYIIDGFSGNEHLMPGVPQYRDVVELIAQSRVFYTPTLIVTSTGPSAQDYFFTNTEVYNDPKARRFMPHNLLDAKTGRRRWARIEEYNFPRAAASLAKIVRAGGNVCVGSHGQFQGLAFHWEMWALGSAMTPMEVLRAATLTGAEAIGYAADLGSIETGKLADLVVLDKDPLLNIKNTNSIKYVMKNGELFEGDTLNQLWPERKALPSLWWWNDRPEPTVPIR
ncbi:MAG: PD40 domain-containing protein [Planctomycetes bacterium]|nr:PD40 domain-containing protein [Planctomycetota bacterium]